MTHIIPPVSRFGRVKSIVDRLPLPRGRNTSGAIWSLLDGFVAQALSLIVFAANTHFLPPSAFGALATSIVLVELLRQLVFVPVANSVNSQQYVSDSEYTIAFMINLAISLVSAVVLVLSYPYLDVIFPATRLTSLVPFMAISGLILSLSTVYEAILARKLQFRSLAIRSIISVSVGGSGGLLLAINGYGIWSLVWQQILQQGLSLGTIVFLSEWRPEFTFSRRDVKRIFGFATHISFNGLIGFMGYQADTLAIAYFLGPRDTGLFNSAKRIGTALNQVMIKPLERVALPALVQFGGDIGRLKSAYLRAIGLTALGTAPVFFGVALISGDIVGLLLGPKWSGVAPVLSALAVSFFGSTIVQYNLAVIMVARKPKLQSICNIVGVSLSLVLIVSSVRYGIIGVAIAVAVRSTLMFPIETFLAMNIVKCSFRDVLRALTPSAIASGLMTLALWILSVNLTFDSLLDDLLIKVLIGATVYATVLLAFFKRMMLELIKGGQRYA